MKKYIFNRWLFVNKILILMFLNACNTLTGHRGTSECIEESLKRKVFIAEYTTIPNPYIINDSLKITVREAWLEKRWAYSNNLEKSIITSGYQICIKTEEYDLKGIDLDWTIGVNSKQYIRKSAKSSLISDLETIPNEIIEYKVQKGDNLSDSAKKEIVGKFILKRKFSIDKRHIKSER